MSKNSFSTETMNEVIKNELLLDTEPSVTDEFIKNETGAFEDATPDFAFPPQQTLSVEPMTPMDSYKAEFGEETVDEILGGGNE